MAIESATTTPPANEMPLDAAEATPANDDSAAVNGSDARAEGERTESNPADSAPSDQFDEAPSDDGLLPSRYVPWSSPGANGDLTEAARSDLQVLNPDATTTSAADAPTDGADDLATAVTVVDASVPTLDSLLDGVPSAPTTTTAAEVDAEVPALDSLLGDDASAGGADLAFELPTAVDRSVPGSDPALGFPTTNPVDVGSLFPTADTTTPLATTNPVDVDGLFPTADTVAVAPGAPVRVDNSVPGLDPVVGFPADGAPVGVDNGVPGLDPVIGAPNVGAPVGIDNGVPGLDPTIGFPGDGIPADAVPIDNTVPGLDDIAFLPRNRVDEPQTLNDIRNGGFLTRGDNSPAVGTARQMMTDLGFTGGVSDNFNRNAARMTRGVQEAWSLPADGVFGRDTLSAVQQALGPFSGTIPDGQITTAEFGAPSVRLPVRGMWDPGETVRITSAFNEPAGHGDKGGGGPEIRADDPLRVGWNPSANRNLGIDYIAQNADGTDNDFTHNWFNGVVRETNRSAVFQNGPIDRAESDRAGAWGRTVVMQTDFTYPVNNPITRETRRLPVMAQYGHLESINVREGQRVNAGQILGRMGGAGPDGDGQYPEHNDLQIYVEMPRDWANEFGVDLRNTNQRRIQIDPNIVIQQAAKDSIQAASADPFGAQELNSVASYVGRRAGLTPQAAFDFMNNFANQPRP
ncbi:MAG: hypothetical protein AAF772_07055 [Acidobacteriota bacterium]